MAEPARKIPSYADLCAVPAPLVAEIVDGELVAQPRPALRHAHAASSLGGDLFSPFQRGRGGPGGWVFLFEPELHLGADVLVPDLAGWRADRAPDLAAPWTALAPDWLCEVLSDSTRTLDRVRKLPLYARAGVGHVWLLDPGARSLECYRRQEGGWLLVAAFGENDRVRAEPFEAIELELAGLWGTPP
ncbi:MAG: Uma2 family endonuclease [Myxococcales bacterium]|nr:Uma2 family endonuclease [Myxococcales bacterium]